MSVRNGVEQISADRLGRESSAESNAPQDGSGRNRGRISIRTVTGTHASLTSSRSQHVRITAQLARKQEYRTRQSGNPHPTRRVSALHGVSGPTRNARPEATWAQPLSREELS